ncbi:ferritin [Corynebacterium macginleyi]|uniref:Ferritin n=1 Tax=Corynebacterium macginleyi TaxID=38290 RepID=A0A3M0G6K3_9CORY|nr:ferritin [Corynebacterium macginleyi]MBK4138815.1 ferritin [Corynebacterium macginleyi]MBK4139676.1 ferritin [Corynebacterium macginleyi]MBK4142269.1 ferritin [Corynebacterium macginleyi]MBK4143647.1 ferritin [Corynebacterium macginleyi]MBK4145402.1 ferritin [Corynebacterium macginleyi]
MDEKLQTLLNNQVINEHGAAMVYTQLAYEMDNLSFPGMRDWFMAQAAEERVHAQKLADHLLARGYRVELNDIPVGSIKAATPLDAFEASLAHEQKVSEQIREIARVALDVQDLDSRQLIDWFLSEQIEEEAGVSEIIDQIKLVGNDGAGLLRIDSHLANRNS